MIAGGDLVADLRYTRRCRRDVTRLHRKLERRLTHQGTDQRDDRPEWLDAVERESEQKDVCPKCGQLIPAYAEGVCPRCLQSRKLAVAVDRRGQALPPPHLGRAGAHDRVSALNVIPPLLSYQLTHSILTRNMSGLLTACALLVLTHIGFELVNGGRLYLLSVVGTRITSDLRHKVYAHLHELSLRYFAKRRTGSLITRVTNDTDRLWDFIVFGPSTCSATAS